MMPMEKNNLLSIHLPQKGVPPLTKGGRGDLIRPVANERGAALIMAIIMLVVLTILGSVVLMSSDTELKISGNYQAAKQTFWVADRAIEYAISRDILMDLSTSDSVDFVPTPVCWPPPTPDAPNPSYDLTHASCVHKTRIEQAGGGFLTAGVVNDLGPGELPAKIAADYGTDFGANIYQVSVTSQQTPAPNAAEVNIDASIVRIFKNDSDSIFLTTGGG